jgi:hypothetical protein
MDTNQLLAELDAEIARLEEVKRLLTGSRDGAGIARRKPGRKRGRTLSPEARERIAAAQRKRWAKAKRG